MEMKNRSVVPGTWDRMSVFLKVVEGSRGKKIFLYFDTTVHLSKPT